MENECLLNQCQYLHVESDLHLTKGIMRMLRHDRDGMAQQQCRQVPSCEYVVYSCTMMCSFKTSLAGEHASAGTRTTVGCLQKRLDVPLRRFLRVAVVGAQNGRRRCADGGATVHGERGHFPEAALRRACLARVLLFRQIGVAARRFGRSWPVQKGVACWVPAKDVVDEPEAQRGPAAKK